MKYKFASDCHNHSACSPDGHDAIAAMCARAAELGLYAYTLTDHCECQKYEERYRARVENAWAQMGAARPPEGLRFYRGIEPLPKPPWRAGAMTLSSAPSTISGTMRISFF